MAKRKREVRAAPQPTVKCDSCQRSYPPRLMEGTRCWWCARNIPIREGRAE